MRLTYTFNANLPPTTTTTIYFSWWNHIRIFDDRLCKFFNKSQTKKKMRTLFSIEAPSPYRFDCYLMSSYGVWVVRSRREERKKKQRTRRNAKFLWKFQRIIIEVRGKKANEFPPLPTLNSFSMFLRPFNCIYKWQKCFH